MAYVFGFLGLFVAIPLLAVVVVTVRTLWVDTAPVSAAPAAIPDAATVPPLPESV